MTEKDKEKDRERDQPNADSGGEKPWWSEAVRDLTSAGLAAFFMTEDSVRNYLKEKKFPKEMVSLLLDGVSRKKEDVYGMVAKEVARVFSKVDITAEMSKFLEKHKIHLEAKVSFEPKTGAEKNSVKIKHEVES